MAELYIGKKNPLNKPDDVLESYKIYLEVEYHDHLKLFLQREKSNKYGAIAEAIVFSILRENYKLEVSIAEDISDGGVDFLCKYDNEDFIVETTHLDSESITEKSSMTDEVKYGEVTSFAMITNKLLNTVKSKTEQLSDYGLPSVLFITASHIASDILLDCRAAELLMIPEKISVEIGKELDDSTKVTTDLETSVFIKFGEGGNISACRKTVSAIILLSIHGDSSTMIGMLHPEPNHLFNHLIFQDIPF